MQMFGDVRWVGFLSPKLTTLVRNPTKRVNKAEELTNLSTNISSRPLFMNSEQNNTEALVEVDNIQQTVSSC
jgi:hypothetical protein